MFDSVVFKTPKGEDHEIQFKTGPRICATFQIGDKIPTHNGIHFAWEGAFVVYDGILVAAYAITEESDNHLFMFDKWGGAIEFPELER